MWGQWPGLTYFLFSLLIDALISVLQWTVIPVKCRE